MYAEESTQTDNLQRILTDNHLKCTRSITAYLGHYNSTLRYLFNWKNEIHRIK